MRALLQIGALIAFNLAASFALRVDVVREVLRDWFGANVTLGTLVVNAINGLSMLALAWWFSRHDASRRATFGWTRISTRHTVRWALVVVIASKLAAIPLLIVARALPHSPDDTMIRAVEHLANGPLVLVIAIALWAGIWEELVFRGFILGACARRLGDGS